MKLIKRELMRFFDYLLSEAFITAAFTLVFKIVAVIIIAYLVIRIGKKLIEKIFTPRENSPIRISRRREETLKKLIENTLVYTVYLLTILTLLQTVGIKIGPLLAGAGIAGLAIGFGAQNLVKDIISGFFIVFEDQFAVGDHVLVSDVEGNVEEIGLRTTKIKSFAGERYVVPNGNITQVTNFSIHNGIAVAMINLPYETDLERAKEIINQTSERMFEETDYFVEVPKLLGVESLDLSHYVVKVVGETAPDEQWEVGRYMREAYKKSLYVDDLSLPAPRLIMYSNDEEHKEVDTNGRKNI